MFTFKTRPFTFIRLGMGAGSLICGISLVGLRHWIVLVELVAGGLLSCKLVFSQPRTSILVQGIFGACALLRQS